MYQVQLVKEASKEVVKTVNSQTPNIVILTIGETKPESFTHFDHFRLDENHVYKQIYKEIVGELIKMYPEYISHITKEKIGFLVDEKWSPSDNSTENSVEYIDIRRSNKLIKTFLNFDYEIVLKQHFLEKWDNPQLAAALLSVLLRIDPIKGTIKKYGERFQSRVVATFGINYLEENVSIPDVTQTKIHLGEFNRATLTKNGQISMDDIPFDEEPEELEDDFNDGEPQEVDYEDELPEDEDE